MHSYYLCELKGGFHGNWSGIAAVTVKECRDMNVCWNKVGTLALYIAPHDALQQSVVVMYGITCQ